jgi:proteasome accessory factor B
LINLIAALLDTERPMTAEDIREEIAGYDQATFEAFRRAFERDKQDLRAMGIPIELVHSGRDVFSEQPDAYTIPKDRYYLPELDLEPDELAALGLAANAVLGPGEDASSGLMKLSIDSATSPWNATRLVWGADVAAEHPLLGPIYSALLERTPISFDYRTAGGEVSRREVEPYSLAHRTGNWYVVGRDRGRRAIRSFKLARIEGQAARISGRYQIPSDFDARAHIGGEAFEIGGEATETATIRFAPGLRWWAERSWPDAPREEGPQGSLDVEIPVGNVDALVSWAIGFGSDVEIVAPQAARAALIERLAPFLEVPS